MFFMLSVPSPAARTSWRNIAAIASAPSAIRATTMTRTRLPPDRSTTAGLIPVMRFLLSVELEVMQISRGRAGVYARPTGREYGYVTRNTRRVSIARTSGSETTSPPSSGDDGGDGDA